MGASSFQMNPRLLLISGFVGFFSASNLCGCIFGNKEVTADGADGKIVVTFGDQLPAKEIHESATAHADNKKA